MVTDSKNKKCAEKIQGQTKKNKNFELPNCARCSIQARDRLCQKEEGKNPTFCPTYKNIEIVLQSEEELKNPEVLEMVRQASIQEADGYGNKDAGFENIYPVKPRIIEVIEFARKMKYKRLGLAFCNGLRAEAKAIEKIYSAKGFEIVSVTCKIGRVPKEKAGLGNDDKVCPGNFETMCNPIAQAILLNKKKTDFNVMLGLCVGHDTLFLKYANAPCTILAVKDRLLGHNPLAAIYTVNHYYRSIKQ